MSITDLEYEMLDRIIHDEFQPLNGATPESYEDTDAVWADCTLTSKADGGVVSSLIKKNLVWYQGSHTKSANLSHDSTLQISPEGFDVWKEIYESKKTS